MDHDVPLGRGRPQSLSARLIRDPSTLAAAVGQERQLAMTGRRGRDLVSLEGFSPVFVASSCCCCYNSVSKTVKVISLQGTGAICRLTVDF